MPAFKGGVIIINYNEKVKWGEFWSCTGEDEKENTEAQKKQVQQYTKPSSEDKIKGVQSFIISPISYPTLLWADYVSNHRPV